MSLLTNLTNKQLAELIGIASNQSTSRDLHEEFHDWNEKQTGLQVNVDWSRAPDAAIGASVSVTWVIKNGFNTHGYHLASYDRPPKSVKPHPHAKIMAKYAEVAARRVDPWVEFEGRCESKNWTKCCGFNGFHPDYEYRHIGETK